MEMRGLKATHAVEYSRDVGSDDIGLAAGEKGPQPNVKLPFTRRAGGAGERRASPCPLTQHRKRHQGQM